MGFTSLISTGDLIRHLDADDWAVVDCRFDLNDKDRGRKEYLDAHIPGAVYAHLDEDLSGAIIKGETGRHPLPSVEAMESRFGEWGIGHGVQVVVYDDAGGAMASRLWWMLHYAGHEQAAVLDGGWQAWTREQNSVRSGEESNEFRHFEAHLQEHMAANADEVERRRRESDWLVLDARDVGRYRGEFEPIDPIAGHIPGAHSAPFMENLTQDGYFQSPDELRNRFERVLGPVDPEQVIHHCGSGVTACHNALAMHHAGLGHSRLYPGSWSEWITDPERDIATGEE